MQPSHAASHAASHSLVDGLPTTGPCGGGVGTHC
jgi:hypothetical protein